MSGIVAPSYKAGFASPKRGQIAYPQLWEGCIGAWAPLLGQTGSSLYDQGQIVHDGTLTNGPTWAADSLLFASGSSQYVTIMNDGTGVFNIQEYSVSCLFRLNTLHNGTLFSACDNVTYTAPYTAMNINVDTATNGRVALFFNNGGFQSIATPVGALTDTAKWYTFTATYKSGAQRVYIDGVQKGSSSITGTITNYATPVWIGRRSNGVYSNCSIKWVMVHNRVLTQSEAALLALRPGIAYETIHRRSYKSAAVPATNRRRRILLTGSN